MHRVYPDNSIENDCRYFLKMSAGLCAENVTSGYTEI